MERYSRLHSIALIDTETAEQRDSAPERRVVADKSACVA